MKYLLITLLSLGLVQPLWAAEAEWPRISELMWMDRNHLTKQRHFIDDLAGLNFGRPVRGNRTDLILLQRIIDEGLIGRKELKHLQAMGAVLGDVYVHEYDELEWRVYEDEKGISRAVCVPDTTNCLFPITMLSRRIAAGLMPDVEEIYEKGVKLIRPFLPERPFDEY